jgi:trehalose-phosphatase
VEIKPASVAVHVRGIESEDADGLLSGIRADWSDLTGESVLEIHEFDGGLELRVPGRDKGTSVRAVLEDAHAETAAAFLGDDRTDEDAFAALRGRGLCVLVRSEFRETLADMWIRPPGELLTFLERWNRAAAAE